MADEVAPTYESRLVKFKKSWEDSLPFIKAIIPAHVTPERIFSIAVTARQRNPKLLECTDISVLRGIIIGAQLGLDVSGIGGKAYLVPYWNKNTKKLEAQFQAGYRGLMELSRRSGQIAAFYGGVVHDGDDFAYSDGLQQNLVHVPRMGGDDPGTVTGAWVVAVWTNGFRQMQVLNKFQLDKIQASSKANGGPWQEWYEEMCLKSCLKRMCKLLPDSVEVNRALAIEDGAESGEPFVDVELAPEEPALPPPTRTESIVTEIKKRGPGRPPKVAPVPVAVASPPVEEETDDLPDDGTDFEDDDDETEGDEDGD